MGGTWGDDLRRELHAVADLIEPDMAAGLERIKEKLNAQLRPCRTCNGSGLAQIHTYDHGWLCRTCNGTGKV